MLKIEQLVSIINNEDESRQMIRNLEQNLRESSQRETEYRNRRYANLLGQFWKVAMFNIDKVTEVPTMTWSDGSETILDIDAIELSSTEMKLYKTGTSNVLYAGAIRYFDYDKERNSVFIFVEFGDLGKRRKTKEVISDYLVFQLESHKNMTILKGRINSILSIEMEIR